MYNGIGLSTVRGSGTSGYVQRNLSHVPATKEKRKIDYKTEAELKKEEKIRGPNQGILDHEKKRKIEVKCAELEDLLVDQNLGEEEINEKTIPYNKSNKYKNFVKNISFFSYTKLVILESQN